MMDRTISVIIPVINEEDKIGHCLEAVFSQTINAIEVIVVDGHSTDRTVKVAEKFPVQILYEDYHTRAGACQVGVENANGEFISFTDADCIPKTNWLESLLNEFDEGIVGVGGGIVNIGEGIWADSINLISGTFLGSANSVQGRFFKDKRFVKSISGCNNMYRKIDILKVGGFNLRLSTAEDTELNSRMLKLGKLLYTPNAVVLHNHKRGLRKFAKRMYQYGYGRATAGLWDLQVVPPIIAFLLFISLVITPWVLVGMFALYAIMLGFMGIKFAISKMSIIYIISIPIVYVIEHMFYTLGFWRGILKFLGETI